jgi:hypothetical protein
MAGVIGATTGGEETNEASPDHGLVRSRYREASGTLNVGTNQPIVGAFQSLIIRVWPQSVTRLSLTQAYAP